MFRPKNELVAMTRRYPKLAGKVLRRDAKIVGNLIYMWDQKTDANLDNVREAIFQYFLKEMKNISDERYWELLRTIWILTGTIERLPKFRELFTSKRKERYYFSTPEEAKRLREMEFPVRVFRAANKAGDGVSWTLDLQYAQKYQSDYKKEFIFHRDVERHEIFALVERGGEEEIIIL